MLDNTIKSILYNNGEAKLIDFLKSENVVSHYKRQLDIDVSYCFKGVNNIGLYKCCSTSYKFFYPFSVAGDGKFYEQLEKFDWYYMPWKWEHEEVKKLLAGNERILEIGSGGFYFVEKMNSLGYDITGLEINQNCVLNAKEKGLRAENKSIQKFSEFNKEKFDLVCSFQVLEHIAEVHSFLKSQVDCLRVGGRLIISVPNNDSFIKHAKNNILNSPPHHMGLWNKSSLGHIANIFNLQIESVKYEPLQDYHIDWYTNIIMNKFLYNKKFIGRLFKKFGLYRYVPHFVMKYKRFLRGHSILVTYSKN